MPRCPASSPEHQPNPTATAPGAPLAPSTRAAVRQATAELPRTLPASPSVGAAAVCWLGRADDLVFCAWSSTARTRPSATGLLVRSTSQAGSRRQRGVPVDVRTLRRTTGRVIRTADDAAPPPSIFQIHCRRPAGVPLAGSGTSSSTPAARSARSTRSTAGGDRAVGNQRSTPRLPTCAGWHPATSTRSALTATRRCAGRSITT
jgi:hypothetical protein